MSTTNAVKELAIVKAVMALLKLDDAGKISKFFNQEIKAAKEAISGLKLNLQVKALEYQQEVSKSDKAIEDAKEAVNDAFVAVTVEDVANNAKSTAFADTYWYNVKRAEDTLEALEEQAKQSKEAYDKAVEKINDQIAKYQARIDKIEKFK